MVFTIIFIYSIFQQSASAFEVLNSRNGPPRIFRHPQPDKYQCPSKYINTGSKKNNLCLRYFNVQNSNDNLVRIRTGMIMYK